MYSNALNTDSAGVAELVNLKHMFYTPSFGTPDVLFCSLLANAREAYAITTGSASQQTNPQQTDLHAETYMAGLLLSDENFVPGRVLRSYGHHYTFDFLAGTIQLRTEIYAAQQQSSFLFTVKIEGDIRESVFLVRHAVTDHVLAKVPEEEIKKPDFFSQELPLLAYHAQLDPKLATATGTDSLLEQSFELRVPLDLNGEVKTVLIRKEKGTQHARVLNPDTGQPLGLLPPDSLNNLDHMVEALQKILTP